MIKHAISLVSLLAVTAGGTAQGSAETRELRYRGRGQVPADHRQARQERGHQGGRLLEELLRIRQATGKTVVFITHGIDEAVYLGQRVAVMTPAPGRIRAVVEVSFDSREGDLRGTARFGEYRHAIWSLLREEAVPVA